MHSRRRAFPHALVRTKPLDGSLSRPQVVSKTLKVVSYRRIWKSILPAFEFGPLLLVHAGVGHGFTKSLFSASRASVEIEANPAGNLGEVGFEGS